MHICCTLSLSFCLLFSFPQVCMWQSRLHVAVRGEHPNRVHILDNNGQANGLACAWNESSQHGPAVLCARVTRGSTCFSSRRPASLFQPTRPRRRADGWLLDLVLQQESRGNEGIEENGAARSRDGWGHGLTAPPAGRFTWRSVRTTNVLQRGMASRATTILFLYRE
jgi:hypothetical protein